MVLPKRPSLFSSTLSIDSINSTMPDDPAADLLQNINPNNIEECNQLLNQYEEEVNDSTRKMSESAQKVKSYKSEKAPLMRVKDALQEEISRSNIIINEKSEEATQLKNKLRHHSEKQVHNNIERLEHQMRINNYKPKEEQKILDEISFLRRSIKILKEYQIIDMENKKYRNERQRLIEQRNDIYNKIHSVCEKEEEKRREVRKLKHEIASTKKIIEHLNDMKKDYEEKVTQAKIDQEEAKRKKIEEKSKAKKESIIKRKEERKKLWKEYEASIEPFEAEKNMCKILISYMEDLIPKDKFPEYESTFPRFYSEPPNLVLKPLTSHKSSPPIPKDMGTFYKKSKEDTNLPSRMSKKEKAKAKKAAKDKQLTHPACVLADMLKLELPIPKTAFEVSLTLTLLASKLDDLTVKSNEIMKSRETKNRTDSNQENASEVRTSFSIDDTLVNESSSNQDTIENLSTSKTESLNNDSSIEFLKSSFSCPKDLSSLEDPRDAEDIYNSSHLLNGDAVEIVKNPVISKEASPNFSNVKEKLPCTIKASVT